MSFVGGGGVQLGFLCAAVICILLSIFIFSMFPDVISSNISSVPFSLSSHSRPLIICDLAHLINSAAPGCFLLFFFLNHFPFHS